MSLEIAPLKIAEVRQLVKGHKREQLEYLVCELYKMLNKNQKLENDVDNLLRKPSALGKTAQTKGEKGPRPFDQIKKETKFFITNAYAQNYLIPNQNVSKKDRPQWRFLVKKVFKELKSYMKQTKYQVEVAELYEKLYDVLCYSCAYQLFTAYDAFESIGITQTEFFDVVLKAIEQVTEKPVFIEKGIDLILKSELNRYTLYSELMDVFISHLETTDMKYMLIEKCKIKRETVIKKGPDKKGWPDDYKYMDNLNNLTELVFRSYAGMYEINNAINYYKELYIEKDPEIKLYILVAYLLMQFGEKDAALHELQEAEKQGIKLRSSLISLKDFIIKNDSFPKYI